MKKFFITLSIVSLTFFAVSAQTFEKGTRVFSAGVGIGSSYYGSGYAMTIPPVFASYEHGVVDNLFGNGKGVIGIGGLLGYTGARWKYLDTSYNVNYITFAARGALHYEFIDKLDTYAGLSLGYYLANSNISGDVPTQGRGGSLVWELNAGARYYFTPKIAAMAEVGYGISVLNIGVSFKL